MADDLTRGAMPPLRIAVLAVAAAGTLFFLYALYAIWTAPAGDGTGFNLLAVVPLGLIFLALTVPALILGREGRSLRSALVFGLLGLAAQQGLWWGVLVHELYG